MIAAEHKYRCDQARPSKRGNAMRAAGFNPRGAGQTHVSRIRRVAWASVAQCSTSDAVKLSPPGGQQKAVTATCPWRTAAIVALLASTVGCTDRNDTRSTPAEAGTVVSRKADQGPVSITLSATPGELDLPQHATVRVEIVAETGVMVTPDPYERLLDEDEHHFDYRIVRAWREEAVPTTDGKLRWANEYELEFILPGEYELPPARVSFVDARATRAEAAGQPSEAVPAEPQGFETESLPIVVRQPVGAELTIEELMDITMLDPVELPRQWGYWLWLGPAIAVALIVVLLALIRGYRRRPEVVIVIPAHEWAQGELARLVREDLVAKGHVQAFYYRISGIVRGYIERRFCLAAPEMTTAEFLIAVASDRRFGETMTQELNRFLTACDLVKYARHQPERAESDRLLPAAGEFIERTCERDGQVETKVVAAGAAEEHAA